MLRQIDARWLFVALLGAIVADLVAALLLELMIVAQVPGVYEWAGHAELVMLIRIQCLHGLTSFCPDTWGLP